MEELVSDNICEVFQQLHNYEIVNHLMPSVENIIVEHNNYCTVNLICERSDYKIEIACVGNEIRTVYILYHEKEINEWVNQKLVHNTDDANEDVYEYIINRDIQELETYIIDTEIPNRSIGKFKEMVDKIGSLFCSGSSKKIPDMFNQIDRMVKELNAEYSIQLKTEHSNTSVHIEFLDHPFVKESLCTVYVEEDDKFRFIKNGMDITSDDITKLKTLIETDVFKEHFTLTAAITKMIKHYFNDYLVSEVGINRSTTKGIIDLPVKTHEGTNFHLIVNRQTGEVRAKSDTSEMVYVSNTPIQIVMIDQTIRQTIEQLLTMISKHSDVKLPSPSVLKNTKKSLHDYRNKGIQQILAFRGSYILSHIFYSYLISKYKNTCNKIENNPDFFIGPTDGMELNIQQIKSAENVAHCITHDKLSMFIIPLAIYGGEEEGAHANLLVYRRKFHTI